ncbi:hypothetical protein MBH78_04715 [Oceanimonas sp. NS1]|nr:hypothetical protein [Oceanimonas sp. NS1]
MEAGILYQAGAQHRAGLQGQYLALLNTDAEQDAVITASWNWAVNRRLALRSQLQYQHWHTENTSMKLTAYFYY